MSDTVFRPTAEEIQDEIDYLRHRSKFRKRFWIILILLLLIIAGAVIALLQYFPILKVKGDGMEPTLEEGQIVLAIKGEDAGRGDMIAFRHKDQTLMKRIIGLPGDMIFIRGDGTVLVNGEELDEAYIEESSLGDCDLDFPYEVPKGKLFVMGDNREDSVDSRSDTVGCISEKKIIGVLKFRIWPFCESESY